MMPSVKAQLTTYNTTVPSACIAEVTAFWLSFLLTL